MTHPSIQPEQPQSVINVPSVEYAVTHDLPLAKRPLVRATPCETCGRKKLGNYCRSCIESLPPVKRKYAKPMKQPLEAFGETITDEVGDREPPYLPTQEQIAAECALIQESWDTQERERRTPEAYSSPPVDCGG